MFCPNCGAETDGGKFCAVCGSPLPMMPQSAGKEAPEAAPVPVWETPQTPAYPAWEAPQATPEAAVPEEGKKKKKLLPWILAGAGALLLLAALVLLIVFVFAKKDPASQVAAAAAKSLSAVKKTEAGKTASELEKSEIKVSMDLQKIIPYAYGLDGTVDVTLSDDMDAGKISLLLSLAVKGKELADLGIYMDEKALAVKSDTLLGDDVYGVAFDSLPDDLKKSIFAPDSGTYYELPEYIYNMLHELDESPIKLYKEARGSLEELAEEGGMKFLESLKKNAEITQEDGKLAVGSSKVECRVIKAEADEKATEAIVEDMIEWLKEDATKKKLERFFNVAVKVMNIVQSGRYNQDAEDLMDDFYDRLEDAVDEMEDSESVLRFYINKANNQLIGFSMDYEGDSSEGSVEIAMGPDFENPEELRVVTDIDGEKRTAVIEVTENTDSLYKAEITVTEDRDEENFEFEWKKKRGSFTLSQDGREVLSGNLEIEDDQISMEVDDAGYSVTIKKGGKTPDVPKYQNILKMNEDDFEDLVDDIQDQIQDIARKFY